MQSSSDPDGSALAGERLAALLEQSRQAAERHVRSSEALLGGGDFELENAAATRGRWVPAADGAVVRARERAADSTPILLRRLGVAPRSLLVALAVALLVAAGAVLRVATADGPSSQVPVSRNVSSSGAAGQTVAPAPNATGTPSPAVSASGLVVVHVVGQVARPGIVRLAAGSRVVDAVVSAGGSTRAADMTRVNLARPLLDGEQIYVPKVGEAAPVASAGAGATAPGSGAAAGAGIVDLNTADLQALDSLPGVGPVLAQRILTWREQHGSFSTVDELAEIQGIGDKLLASLRPLVKAS